MVGNEMLVLTGIGDRILNVLIGGFINEEVEEIEGYIGTRMGDDMRGSKDRTKFGKEAIEKADKEMDVKGKTCLLKTTYLLT